MTRRDCLLALLLVLAGELFTLAWAERIGVNSGLGWDGRAYAAWARDVPGVVQRHDLDSFQAQRLLPSAAVFYADATLGISHTTDHVIEGFQVLDCLDLMIVCVCLCAITRALGWSRCASWVAFASCFGGFAVARHALYVPVLTDDTALMLGSVSLVGFLTRRTWLVAGSLVVSLFVWPALIVVNAAALMFPRRSLADDDDARSTRHVAGATAVVFLCTGCAWFWKALAGYHDVDGMEAIIQRSHRGLWPITIVLTIGLLALAGWHLGRPWGKRVIAAYLTRGALCRAVAGGAFVIACVLARDVVVDRIAPQHGFGLEELEYYYAGNALRAPLWSLVHHVVYFGPIVLVFVARFRQIAGTTRELGLAAFVVMSAVVMVSITPETRHLIAFLPWIVVLAVHATRDAWTPRALGIYVALTVVWSKLWWSIGYERYHDSFRFPDQRYWMHLGPWSTDLPFVIHGAAAVVTAVVLAWVLGGPARARPTGEFS